MWNHMLLLKEQQKIPSQENLCYLLCQEQIKIQLAYASLQILQKETNKPCHILWQVQMASLVELQWSHKCCLNSMKCPKNRKLHATFLHFYLLQQLLIKIQFKPPTKHEGLCSLKQSLALQVVIGRLNYHIKQCNVFWRITI